MPFALALHTLEIEFCDRLLHLLVTFNLRPIVSQIEHLWVKIILFGMIHLIFLGM